MAAIDDPERYSFMRAGGPVGAPSVMAQWTDVLTGDALMLYRERMGLMGGRRSPAAYRRRQRSGGGMRFGFSRGGKPIDAGDKSNQ